MLRGRGVIAIFIAALFCTLSTSNIGAQEGDSAYVRAESLVVVEHDNFSHDSDAYTQGLEFYQGRLFESTGLRGNSSLREVNLSTGEVIRSIDLDESEFGEGITFVGGDIIQLTWQSEVAYRYDVDTFEVIANYTYDGEGWGLAYDGEYLIMSNGSNVLQFRNASTFELVSTINVTLNNESLSNLNELEYWDGLLYANIYHREEIVAIDISSGVVVLHIDASGLKTPGGEVLNGIAFDATTQSLWITGKYWSKMYNITFIEPTIPPTPDSDTDNISAETPLQEINSVYSTVILAILLISVPVLLILDINNRQKDTGIGMNLKDGGHNPTDAGVPK
ncbi:MAG: glutaminyl-peptide cyclotransferase [Candidatus Thalassarchaeaceae archaeon]|nr:glutaminyl-peptide cyclotransferase [Candidatus Thalassarchaeaceae archaeon]